MTQTGNKASTRIHLAKFGGFAFLFIDGRRSTTILDHLISVQGGN